MSAEEQRREERVEAVDLKDKAVEIFNAVGTICLVSLEENGNPRPAYLIKISNDGLKEIILATSLSSQKITNFRKNPKAAVACERPDGCMTFQGSVEILSDEESRNKYWVEEKCREYYKDGPADTNLCFIKFTSEKVYGYIEWKPFSLNF